MTSTLDLGSNYTLEESSNGNLLIKDSTGTVVLKHADGGDFSLGAALELGDLVDGSTGDTVYDGSTETLGNGTQDADLQSVKTTSGTVDGDELIGFPSGIPSDAGLSFDTFVEVDANRPVLLLTDIRVDATGSNTAVVDVKVDYDGDGSADRTYFGPKSQVGDGSTFEHFTIPLPAGAQVKVLNKADPDGSNIILSDDVFQL